MRRKDREMSQDFALEVTGKCEWAVLSMVDAVGKPYCVPLTIVCDGMTVYFHSAHEGQKVDCLRRNSSVCLVCVGDTFRTPDQFTTEYESAILRGAAAEVINDDEKIHALRLLCQRHTPTNMEAFNSAIAQSLSRTAVWKIQMVGITGKRKKYDTDGKEMKFGRME